MSEAITVDRLERGLALCAYLVERDGTVAVPLFERLERELAVMRQTQDTVARAKRLVEAYTGRHPRLSLAPPIDQIEDGPGTGVHSTAPQSASDPQ
ncbi:Ser/Thr protein kinase RdoA (MazF antagonist) [Bradyrhizobium sp. LM6.10]